MISQETSIHQNPTSGHEIHNQSQGQQSKQTISHLPHQQVIQKSLLKRNHLNLDQDQLQKRVNEFLQSKIQLNQIQTDENHDQFCVCPDCTYERNLNKPSHSLFNLTMRSIYRQNFTDNSNKKDEKNTTKKLQKQLHSKFNAKDINQKQTSIFPKNKVSLQTIYNVQMGKFDAQERRKSLRNQDLLKFDGPFSSISTYTQRFPGVTGGNPYVKPVDKAVRDNFSLNTKTMNQTFYKGQFTARSNLAKSPDNIKTGLPMLFKQSTSQKFYSKPSNPEEYNQNKNSLPKRQATKTQNFNDKQQFNSTYRQSFNGQNMFELAKQKKRLIRDTWTKLGMMGY